MSGVAVIGGGINGVMTAWELARRGHRVDLFERHTLMSATSSASTKLLHGGLRYLEHGHVNLVREGLRERAWWIRAAPHLAKPIRLLLPIYRKQGRSLLKLKLGLWFYDVLARQASLGPHRWHSRNDVQRMMPRLRQEGLLGAFSFFDGQMDDRKLGRWAAEQAKAAGVRIHERTEIDRVSPQGEVYWGAASHQYDYVFNVAGPWACSLLKNSGLRSRQELDIVRGSHVLMDRAIEHGLLVQVPGQSRICFILPYDGRTLIGTTEMRQSLEEPVVCSDEERDYLLGIYRYYLPRDAGAAKIHGQFAGLRPLIRGGEDTGAASREHALEKNQRLITVLGGKWTTSRALAQRAARLIQ